MEMLEVFNPWWKSGEVSTELAPDYKRRAFEEVMRLLPARQVTVISGLRRVGKSTLMHQAIRQLLEKTPAASILYFSFDERADSILDVLEGYQKLAGVDWRGEKCFLFLDEIQKLGNWSNKLKIIYDRFHNLKITVSGSSSFQLEREARANLAGRHFSVSVDPLEFREFLQIRQSKADPSKPQLWERELKKEFGQYLLRPFPEIVGLDDLGLVKSYIKESVIEKILKVDLPQKFRKINEELLLRLVEIVYDRPGTYLNYDALSKELAVGKEALLQHFHFLEYSYVIRRVKNFRPAARTVSRKLQRAYPYHWSLQFGLNGKTDFETIVATFFDAKYYWRKNGSEIDFLLVGEKISPVEAKEIEKTRADDLATLSLFMKKNNCNGLLVYQGVEEKMKVGNHTLTKIPLWKLFLANPDIIL